MSVRQFKKRKEDSVYYFDEWVDCLLCLEGPGTVALLGSHCDDSLLWVRNLCFFCLVVSSHAQNMQRANIYTDKHARMRNTYIHYTHNTVCCVKCFGWSNTVTHTCFYNLDLVSQGINSLYIGIIHALRAATLPHIHTLFSQAFHLNFWLYMFVFHINFLKSFCGLNPPLSCLKEYTTQGQTSSS